MEGMRKGAKVKTTKTKTKVVRKKKTTKTTQQVAHGKKIAQFKGTGSQVIINVPRERRAIREDFKRQSADGMSSILPSVFALQQSHQSNIEKLLQERNRSEQHIGQAEAVRAGHIGDGNALAAGDQARRLAGLAAEIRQQNRRILHEEQLVSSAPSVAESRELYSTASSDPSTSASERTQLQRFTLAQGGITVPKGREFSESGVAFQRATAPRPMKRTGGRTGQVELGFPTWEQKERGITKMDKPVQAGKTPKGSEVESVSVLGRRGMPSSLGVAREGKPRRTRRPPPTAPSGTPYASAGSQTGSDVPSDLSEASKRIYKVLPKKKETLEKHLSKAKEDLATAQRGTGKQAVRKRELLSKRIKVINEKIRSKQTL